MLIQSPSPPMQWKDLQAWWDSSPEELRLAIVGIIDDLISAVDGASGADNIGATPITGVGDETTNTVQKILEALKALDDANRTYLLTQIQGIILGQVPDGSITDMKLSDVAGQLKDKVNLHLNQKASKTAQGHVQVDGTTITSNDGVISAVQQKKPVGAKMYQYNNSWGGF